MESAGGRRFDLFLTAQEAYPAFEELFLSAQKEILASFRVFDPTTKLRSEAARRFGDTWADLITATLNRGVMISLVISDFDPVVRGDDHAFTTRCVRAMRDAATRSDHPSRLNVRAGMHPARAGLLPRLALLPGTLSKINAQLQGAKNRSDFEKILHDRPGLVPMVKWRGDTLVARKIPPPSLVPVTHHQKIAVFDEKLVYIGGLDLNERRYDTPEHDRPSDETWHDVQVIVDGPAAQEAAAHLRRFEAEVNGQPVGKTQHLLRTLSARRKFDLPFLAPKAVCRELAAAHADGVAQAQDLIYLETQFFRDRKLAKALAKRAKQNPKLTLIIVVPAAPEDVAFDDNPGSDAAYGEYLQAKCVDIVRDAFGARVFIGSPAQCRSEASDGRDTYFGAPLIYLHAKVAVFDDSHAIVCSANLNGRSLSWDTETGIATRTAAEAALVKSRCFTQWLGKDADPACFDASTACAAWAAQAAQNAKLPPEKRQGFILPYDVEAAKAFGFAVPGVPAEMV